LLALSLGLKLGLEQVLALTLGQVQMMASGLALALE
jgi:hypothetical protein